MLVWLTRAAISITGKFTGGKNFYIRLPFSSQNRGLGGRNRHRRGVFFPFFSHAGGRSGTRTGGIGCHRSKWELLAWQRVRIHHTFYYGRV